MPRAHFLLRMAPGNLARRVAIEQGLVLFFSGSSGSERGLPLSSSSGHAESSPRGLDRDRPKPKLVVAVRGGEQRSRDQIQLSDFKLLGLLQQLAAQPLCNQFGGARILTRRTGHHHPATSSPQQAQGSRFSRTSGRPA